MTWLRARSRVVAMVALFAMVLQIAGTFGHVHIANPSAPQAFAKSFAAEKFSAIVSAAVDIAANADTGAPPSDGDALCPICLVGHLVASAVVAATPSLAVPVAYARLAPLQLVSVLDSTPALISFWSRGPPTS